MTDMTIRTAGATAARSATWADFLVWAKAHEEYSTVKEIAKVSARLGMLDEDAGLIPADLGYFERTIAPSSFAPVSKSRDLKTARDRSNSRVRAALKRFLAARNPSRAQRGRGAWDALIAHVEANASTPDRGGLFNVSNLRSLETLRARSPVAPCELSQDILDLMCREASSGKRGSIKAGVEFLNRLVVERAAHAEISSLLPDGTFARPAGSSRAAPIAWESLPAPFRASCETAFKRALGNPEAMIEELRARAAAGEDPVLLHAELEAEAACRGDGPGNEAVAIEGYRTATTWLVRAVEGIGQPRATLSEIGDVMTYPVIDAATQEQIRRSREAPDLKDPEKSQTLRNRLQSLEILARYGLRSEDIARTVSLVRTLNKTFVVEPGRDGLVEEIDDYCRLLQRTPSMAVALVNAPARIARKAEEALEAARAKKDKARELSALRLYACAVMFAVQMSRPMRTSNLIRMRHRSCATAKGNLTWITEGAHAELRFPPGEIKNAQTVIVHLLGEDAAILWRWMSELRARYIELRDIEDTIYILPGAAKPRLTKRGVKLPMGCLAPSSAAEIWAEGAAEIGVRLTPHMARHSVATLILAMEPGNFAKCGSVLGDTAKTVEDHYGRDSGTAAAVEIRKALLARHPDLFETLKRRHSS